MRGRIEDPQEVLAVLATCDVHLLLYSDGVSTRRSSFLTCLQLAQPIVTTRPVEPDEFEGWPVVEGAIEAGQIVCLPADAAPDMVAEAIERAADEAGEAPASAAPAAVGAESPQQPAAETPQASAAPAAVEEEAAPRRVRRRVVRRTAPGFAAPAVEPAASQPPAEEREIPRLPVRPAVAVFQPPVFTEP